MGIKYLLQNVLKKEKSKSENSASLLAKLDKIYAEDIMIQRSEIVALDCCCTKDDVMAAINSGHHSRIPVYECDIDQIKGFVHIKDLFASFDSTFSIADIIRQVIFVPPAMKVSAVLLRMKSYRVHAAIVVDEFGATIGMVTMKDIVEEILGDIDDEHDNEIEPAFIKISKYKFEVSARLELKEFVQKSGIKIKFSDEYRTIGGYILSLTGKVPLKKEKVISPDNIEFFILDADNKKLNMVIINTSNYKSV